VPEQQNLPDCPTHHGGGVEALAIMSAFASILNIAIATKLASLCLYDFPPPPAAGGSRMPHANGLPSIPARTLSSFALGDAEYGTMKVL